MWTRLLLLAAAAVLGLPWAAAAQNPPYFPQTLPSNTVVGRLGGGNAGPAEAIPFTTLSALLAGGSAGANFNSTVTIQPTPLSTMQALDISQSGPAAVVSGSFLQYNLITIFSENYGQGSAALEVQVFDGGSVEAGEKYAGFFSTTHNTATPANPGKGDHIGLFGTAIGSVSDGGTAPSVANGAGTLYGVVSQGSAQSGATNLLIVSGAELDGIIATGASAAHRWGISTVDRSNVQGSVSDAAFEIGALASPIGFKTAILIDSYHGGFPLVSASCVICTDGTSATITTGIDLSSLSFSGNFLKSATFSVSGTGGVRANGYFTAAGPNGFAGFTGFVMGGAGSNSAVISNVSSDTWALAHTSDFVSFTQDLTWNTTTVTVRAAFVAANYTAGASAGVSCSGAPTGSFASVFGIVTHC